jgi:transcriptional regulator with XRE-family HTH domain
MSRMDRYRRDPPEHEQRGLDAIGIAINEGRRRLGISQRALAARSGLSQSTISRLESGRSPGTRAKRLGVLFLALGGVEILPE